jgi:hypothetical protein
MTVKAFLVCGGERRAAAQETGMAAFHQPDLLRGDAALMPSGMDREDARG